MNGQDMHADGTLLPRGHFPKSRRTNIFLGTESEFASSLIKFLLDTPAFLLMLLAVFVLTFLVAIPNAQASGTLLEGITSLAARRAQQLGRGGPIFLVGFLS